MFKDRTEKTPKAILSGKMRVGDNTPRVSREDTAAFVPYGHRRKIPAGTFVQVLKEDSEGQQWLQAEMPQGGELLGPAFFTEKKLSEMSLPSAGYAMFKNIRYAFLMSSLMAIIIVGMTIMNEAHQNLSATLGPALKKANDPSVVVPETGSVFAGLVDFPWLLALAGFAGVMVIMVLLTIGSNITMSRKRSLKYPQRTLAVVGIHEREGSTHFNRNLPYDRMEHHHVRALTATSQKSETQGGTLQSA